MLQHHVSGLPVVDAAGKLVGIVSEGDFIRRGEIGTQKKRSRWLKFLMGTDATQYVREHGRRVSEVMTHDPLTIAEDATLEEIVNAMEANGIKRMPVMRDGKLVGIVSRANLLHAVASLAREIPDPTADDDHIRSRIIQALEKHDWSPFGLNVIVRDGIVHLSGVITDEEFPARGHRCHRKCFWREEGSRPSELGRRHVRDVSAVARRYRDGEKRLGARHRSAYTRALSVTARMMSSRDMIPANRWLASSTGTLFIRWSTINCNTRVSFVPGST